MTSRNLVRLFINTLLVGGFITALVGFIVRWDEFQPYFVELKLVDIASTFIWLFFMGFLFSAISQMGFFAYLTIHRFGLGIFKSVSLWNSVQVVLILFSLFDLVYLRYENFAKSGESVISYLIPAIVLLAAGLITGWFKMKQTNRQAFIPAVFFMVVVTIIEWVPVLTVNDRNWFYLMVLSLLACNAYQLLILHKLNAKSEQERMAKMSQNKQAAKTNKKVKKPSV
ncbi:KinB-signaling pathway activation protein [Neobacillus sp. Marseille-QA0830]